MAEPLTNAQIIAEIGAIEADLSVIMQFMCALADGGFVVEPEGVKVMQSMVFATSQRVSRLSIAFGLRVSELQDLVQSSSDLIEATKKESAEILKLTGLLRRASVFLHSPKDRQEADEALSVMREGLGAIEQRVLGGEPVAKTDNVVQLATRRNAPSTQAPEGGAA